MQIASSAKAVWRTVAVGFGQLNRDGLITRSCMNTDDAESDLASMAIRIFFEHIAGTDSEQGLSVLHRPPVLNQLGRDQSGHS